LGAVTIHSKTIKDL